MTRLRPTSRRELIRRLTRLDFDGPFAGGRHQFMEGRGRRVILPNPHRQDISVDLLTRILKQAGLTPAAWHSAKK